MAGQNTGRGCGTPSHQAEVAASVHCTAATTCQVGSAYLWLQLLARPDCPVPKHLHPRRLDNGSVYVVPSTFLVLRQPACDVQVLGHEGAGLLVSMLSLATLALAYPTRRHHHHQTLRRLCDGASEHRDYKALVAIAFSLHAARGAQVSRVAQDLCATLAIAAAARR